MTKKFYGQYVFAIIAIVMTVSSPLAYGEVVELKTDSDTYFLKDSIKFHGKVEQGDSGLVTIVIRDQNNDFVILTQAIPDHEYNFEKILKINDKFSEHGIYNATGFIVNMTAGITTEFAVSTDGTKIIQKENEESQDITLEEIEELVNTLEIKSGEIIQSEPKKPNFMDPQKDPQYYVDRYYNEPEYKSWFDRNYPDYTIEEAVGYEKQKDGLETTVNELITKEILPEAEASTIVQPSQHTEDNSETAQIVLAVGGLGVLFAAVYGIKKKVDYNSTQISLNKDTIRKRIINPLMGTNPYEILQTRLAKGEITLEEFDRLERKLNKKN